MTNPCKAPNEALTCRERLRFEVNVIRRVAVKRRVRTLAVIERKIRCPNADAT